MNNNNTVKTTLRLSCVALLSACGFLGTHSAMATTATANLAVSTTVTANCSISTSPVAFGNYDSLTANVSTPLDSTGSVSVTCTSGAPTNITLGQGANAAGGSSDAVPLRRMNDGGSNNLAYSLHQDVSHATTWGNTSGTGVTGTGNASLQTLTVYGRVAAGLTPIPGSYTDTVVATVTF